MHFKVETLLHIMALVIPGCFMAVLDLKDAYLVVPIAGIHVKFLEFMWQGKTYMYVVLPFGLSSAPRKFTKLLKPILAMLRRQGIIIVMYIDDGWVKGSDYNECYQSVKSSLELLAKLGFIIHPEKSHPTPAQAVEILGFFVNSITMQITIPETKTMAALGDINY